MNNLPTTARNVPAPLPDTIPESCRGVPFMSSLEIARMTGKQHGHVMRDIERELDKIEEPQSKFGASYLNSQNKRQPCYTLPGDYLLFIASAYDAKLRMQIIRHWSALNDGTAAPVADAATLLVKSLIAGGIEGRRQMLQQDEAKARSIRAPKARRAYLSFAGKP